MSVKISGIDPAPLAGQPSRPNLPPEGGLPKGQDEEGFKKILNFIHEYKGLDLSSYRANFLYRRLRLRIFSTKTKDYLGYITLLKNNPQEYNAFLDALSINVTEFFRDPDVFEAVKKIVLPRLIAKKEAQGNLSLRVWSSACASGEEPYSIAILIKQILGQTLKEKSNSLVRIWASDINNAALEKAKKAEYPAQALENIDSKIINKYFISCGNNCYRVSDEIRQMVKFQVHNLFQRFPSKCLDLIFCRNVLIYLDRRQSKELFHAFSQLLNPGGYLVLGKVEMLWDRDLFVLVDPKTKIYQKVD
jgi:chemotaxis methyl-accepting protein methylase